MRNSRIDIMLLTQSRTNLGYISLSSYYTKQFHSAVSIHQVDLVDTWYNCTPILLPSHGDFLAVRSLRWLPKHPTPLRQWTHLQQSSTQVVEEIHHTFSTVHQHTNSTVPTTSTSLSCKSQLTSPSHNLVIPLPIASTCQFRRDKTEQVWLFWGFKLGLQQWELDVLTTMLSITFVCAIPKLI